MSPLTDRDDNERQAAQFEGRVPPGCMLCVALIVSFALWSLLAVAICHR